MKFGIASMSLFPLPLKAILRKASQAGFDFVEVFLLGKWTDGKVEYVQSVAERLNLELHFHQVWTTESSEESEKWVSRVLTVLGILPPEDYLRALWIPKNARPLVAYAEEASILGEGNEVWFQTIACQRSLTDSAPRCSCKEFLSAARVNKFPLVLDTMHFIEYRRSESGIERNTSTEKEILAEWSKFWSEFNAQVREIHWNDFTRKRNLWPGTGTAPLEAFAGLVKQTGWEGCVVPEVKPCLPFPYERDELLALRKKTDGYFA